MLIGVSIKEAIDWTQDRLVTTRPLAERALFVLLADHRVTETDAGYMLAEDASDDETHKVHAKIKLQMKHRPRSRHMQKHADLRIIKKTEARLTKLMDYTDMKQVDRADRLRATAEKLQQDIELMDASGNPSPLYPLRSSDALS